MPNQLPKPQPLEIKNGLADGGDIKIENEIKELKKQLPKKPSEKIEQRTQELYEEDEYYIHATNDQLILHLLNCKVKAITEFLDVTL